MNRSYSLLNIRAIDDDKRIIEGIATTPTVARDGDILETSGIKFKLPIPFLYRHKEPFGNVVSADVSEQGIAVRIQIPPAGVSASIDEYWGLVKHGVVRGLSIGWRTLEEKFDKAINGFRISRSEWLELSAVPVPADTNATILSVRSADEAILAALGRENGSSNGRTNHNPAGASASRRKGVGMPKTTQDRIASFEDRRSEITERMTAIMEAADDEGKITDQKEQREYDALQTELEEVDKNISRQRGLLAAQQRAVPIPPVPGQEEDRPRARAVVTKEPSEKLPPGTAFARSVISLVRAKGDYYNASRLATENYKDTPEVAMYLRAFVDAGDTTTSGWASQLVPAAQNLQGEFLEMLRPATIIGRIPGLRKVPFNISVPMQTGGGTYGWVGENRPKPVTSATFDSVTLRWAKAAGIIVITDELARFSSPSAEAIIRDEMVAGCTRFLDSQFIDPNVAEVANVSPGSILNGIASTAVSGTSAGAFRYDITQILTAFVVANEDVSKAVLLMSTSTAMALGALINSLGQPEFPTITMNGGSYLGIPIVTSQNVGARVILLNAAEILLADDGGIKIDVSREASVEMDTAPTFGESSPPSTTTTTKSLWQNNLVGIRAERYITWKRARTTSVKWLINASYGPATTSP